MCIAFKMYAYFLKYYFLKFTKKVVEVFHHQIDKFKNRLNEAISDLSNKFEVYILSFFFLGMQSKNTENFTPFMKPGESMISSIYLLNASTFHQWYKH